MYLIVGATGTLGGRVAQLLLERGEHVRALVRAHSPARASAGRFTDPARLRAWGAELVEGDLTRPETLPPALAGVECVFCSASGTKRAPPDTLETVDVAGSTALARAAATAGVRQLVHISTLDADAGGDVPLYRDKGRSEVGVWQAGVPATILQPAKFMQDWIGVLIGSQLQASATAGRPRVQLIGDGEVPQSFVDEGDVARLAVAVLGRTDTLGEVIPLAAEVATYRQLVAGIARMLGAAVAVESLPPGATIDTVPEPLAGVITAYLSMPDTLGPLTRTTPEVAARFGLQLTGIDGYLREALPG